ncbi:hypothetical protein GCM10022295_58910 [Streptomyces osmaniensis]
MGDQGVVDDVETHVHNINRAGYARRPLTRQATGRGITRALASNRPSEGKWEGRSGGGEPMPDPESPERPTQDAPDESDAARRRRRAQFLRELAEARELRDRVQPRRAKAARLRHALRMRTFRW